MYYRQGQHWWWRGVSKMYYVRIFFLCDGQGIRCQRYPVLRQVLLMHMPTAKAQIIYAVWSEPLLFAYMHAHKFRLERKTVQTYNHQRFCLLEFTLFKQSDILQSSSHSH